MLRFFITYLVLGLMIVMRSVSADTEEVGVANEIVMEEYELPSGAEADRVKLAPHYPWAMPDLLVSEITPPERVGNSYVVWVTVQNWGKGSVASSSTLLFRDNNYQSGQSREIGALSHGQSARLSFYVSPPENQGPWYFSAIADYGNRVRERSETNNVRNFYQ